MKHEFRVGQIVELKPSVLLRLAAAGQYEILHLMPEPEVSSASPRYRIKSREEVYQRIVSEDELALSTPIQSGMTSGLPGEEAAPATPDREFRGDPALIDGSNQE